MEPDFQRIQFVTRQYAALRAGVTRAALGPILLAGGWAGEIVGNSLALMLLNGFGIVLATTILRQWLDSRFGRVVSRSNEQRWVMVACVLTFFLTTWLDRHWAGSGGPSLLFLCATGFAIWLCVRLWPFAIHNLLPASVACGAAILFGLVDSREELMAWERQAYTATLLAWTVAGAVDCALLLRSLPRRKERHADAV